MGGSHPHRDELDRRPGGIGSVAADDSDDRLLDDGEEGDAVSSCGAKHGSCGPVVVGLVDLCGMGRAERRRCLLERGEADGLEERPVAGMDTSYRRVHAASLIAAEFERATTLNAFSSRRVLYRRKSGTERRSRAFGA
jgi:hypothetical protein